MHARAPSGHKLGPMLAAFHPRLARCLAVMSPSTQAPRRRARSGKVAGGTTASGGRWPSPGPSAASRAARPAAPGRGPSPAPSALPPGVRNGKNRRLARSPLGRTTEKAAAGLGRVPEALGGGGAVTPSSARSCASWRRLLPGQPARAAVARRPGRAVPPAARGQAARIHRPRAHGALAGGSQPVWSFSTDKEPHDDHCNPSR